MIAPAITPAVLRQQFENLIDDTFDITHTYQLMTQAKNYIETTLKLAILEGSDSSQTANAGDTYLTLKALPADFKSMRKVVVGIIPYYPIPFDKKIAFRQIPRRYYIDYKRAVQGLTALALTGVVATAQTINMFYTVTTPACTEANEDTAGVILWPDEFQPIIPYQMAKLVQANIDADEINFRMSASQEAEYQRLLDSFIAWDHDIKLAQMNNQLGYADDVMDGDYAFDIGLM